VIRSRWPMTLPANSTLEMSNNSVEPHKPAGIARRIKDPKTLPRLSSSMRSPGRWTLLAFVSPRADDQDSRGQVALLLSLHRQFQGLDARIIAAEPLANLRYDWNTGDVAVLSDDGAARRALKIAEWPSLVLLNPDGRLVWRHDGFTLPGELGLAIRDCIGSPDYSPLTLEQ